MNKITATGRIAADADIRHTQTGETICSFRLASDIGFGNRKSTNWFSCTVWGKRGEALAPYLKKGTAVTVFGSLTLREWTNKEGHKQLSPDIRIDEITLHGGRNPGEVTETPVQQDTSSHMSPQRNDTDWDDPPF